MANSTKMLECALVFWLFCMSKLCVLGASVQDKTQIASVSGYIQIWGSPHGPRHCRHKTRRQQTLSCATGSCATDNLLLGQQCGFFGDNLEMTCTNPYTVASAGYNASPPAPFQFPGVEHMKFRVCGLNEWFQKKHRHRTSPFTRPRHLGFSKTTLDSSTHLLDIPGPPGL